MKYICNICGFVYGEEIGCPEEKIAPGTAWENIPDDFICPLCGVGKDEFYMETVNCTPFVRQSGIMSNKWGDFYAKGSTKQTIHAGIQETGRGNHAEGKVKLLRDSETI